MKVKKVAVTAAVCAALMGSQASFAGEQPEGMDFAFENTEGSSVEMSELSGMEMDETEGARTPLNVATGAASGGWTGGSTYLASGGTSASGFISSVAGGAWSGGIGGAVSATPAQAYSAGVTSGIASGSYNAMTGQ